MKVRLASLASEKGAAGPASQTPTRIQSLPSYDNIRSPIALTSSKLVHVGREFLIAPKCDPPSSAF